MKQLVYLLIIASMLTAYSCKDESNPVDTNDDGNLETTRYKHPSSQYIGWGFDLTENYADPTLRKGQIFDAEKLPEEWTDSLVINKREYNSVTGLSIDEYQSNLMANAKVSGQYKLFSGSVKTNFSKSYYSYSERSFSTTQYKVRLYQATIKSHNAKVEELRKYMIAAVKKDLNDSTVDPTYIFTQYGTHVLTGAMFGGRFDFSAAMETSKIKTGESLEVMAKAEYKGIFSSASVDSKFKDTDEKNYFEQNSTVKWTSFGGAVSPIGNDGDYTAWEKSLVLSNTDGSNCTFIDYTDNGLIPIWEFCESATRLNQIKSAFDKWVTDSEIRVNPSPEQCIIDIIVTSSKDNNQPSERYENGLTYHKLDIDLNRGAGGKFIYLYYALGLDNGGTYVTDLYLGCDSKHSDKAVTAITNAGYQKIGCDLNEGAKGYFIYLGIKKDKASNGKAPIRALIAHDPTNKKYIFSNPNITTGYYDTPSNGDVPLDLNKGAGGDFIYLKYTKNLK